nr:hypothetical protein BaRGS_016200 [Batillaria attramentaria]
MEDMESVRSELSTVPGSYTGFASRPLPASTPSKKRMPQGDGQPATDDYDSDSSGSLSQGHNSNNHLKLLRQNQRLLSEVERLVCELQKAKQRLTELQDKVEGLQAETEAQDKALRSAEQHLSESQKQVSCLQQELSSCQQELQDMRTELEEEKRVRSSVETQRHELMRNFLETQESLEDYQRRSHERIKKLEEAEDHLRDSLTHTNAERDDLLQQTSMRMKPGMSVYCQENAVLKSQVEEGREVIIQVEELTQQLRRRRGQHDQAGHMANAADDSGNSSIHLGTSLQSASGKGKNSSRVQRERRAGMAGDNMNNSGLTINGILSELRTMLFDMDEEIHRLKGHLASQQEDEHMIRELRTELSMLMERAQAGEQRYQELEKVVGRLEADKSRLAREVTELTQQVADRDSQVLTLDARLSQRNSQIIELQEDVSNRCSEIARLEKEVWKKSAQVSQAESMLEEKRAEMEEHMRRLDQLEHNQRVREEELTATRQQVKSVQMELELCKAAAEHNQATHTARCQEYEAQIDRLQSQVAQRESRCTELQQTVHRAQQDVQDKENIINQLETTLLETKRELSRVTQNGQDVLQQLQDKLSHSTQEVKHLQSALLLCRNEIKDHIQTMERTRQKFDSELSEREKAIGRLEARLKEVQMEITQRTEENIQLESELLEKQTQLQHRDSHINQLQHSEAGLKDNVRQLEQQLLKEKAQWMTEADELQLKMASQAADLDSALAKISELKQTIRELQDENRQAADEQSSLERHLQEERMKTQSQGTHITQLERGMRDLRVELEQKIEIVGDLEEQLRNNEADLQQQQRLVEQLDVDKIRMQREVKQLEERTSQLDDQVQKLMFDVKAKEQVLTDTRDMLRNTQAELSEKSLEASELKDALEERQQELQERVAMVTQLERTIHDTHQEMSQRMARVDSTLQKYESEIKERTGQIADLDDKLQQTQHQLVETSLQLEQQQQLAHHQQLELQAATAKLEELDVTNSRQKQRLEEQKEENVEVTQELRLTREQLQTQHAEFLTARRELAASRRESERLGRELEEMSASHRNKEQNSARLSEELGASQARATQAEARLAAETSQLHRTMHDMQIKHREELDMMRMARDEALEQHSQALEKLGVQAQQLTDNERAYKHRLDQARGELEALHNELSSRKELIRGANETVFMKDSEIARLKTQVARLERKVKPALHVTISEPPDSRSQQSAVAVASTTAVHNADGTYQRTMSTSTEYHRSEQRPHADHSSPSSSRGASTSKQRYYLSLGPSGHLERHHRKSGHLDRSQNAGELPMKDTWDDRDPDTCGDVLVDQLVFSFERQAADEENGVTLDVAAGADVSGGGGGCGGTSGPAVEADVPTPDSCRSLDDNTQGDSNNNAVRAFHSSSPKSKHTVKPKQTDSKGVSKSAPRTQTHSQKVGKRKGKPSANVKSNSRGGSSDRGSSSDRGGVHKPTSMKPSSLKGEKADYSHHHFDPETLVSTYQG